MARILLVDDEPSLVAVLKPVLTAAGHEVAVATTGAAAIDGLASEPDVMLLDLGLPDMDGKDVIAKVRWWSDVPIIVVSARHQEADKIAALDAGADDYVNKPFEIGELMARVRAATRRRTNLRDRVTSFTLGGLAIDFVRRRVTLEGDVLHLPPKEYDILCALAQNAGQVVTHKRLLAAGWGSEATDMQYLRIYIGLLRQKIEADPGAPRFILTEPGIGYRLADA